jgi:RHS repeat-associated protein
MSDEIVEVVEQDLAKPVLESIEKVGEAVPRHFGEIGGKLEQSAANHLENEAGLVTKIEGVGKGEAADGLGGTESEIGGSDGAKPGGSVGGGSEPLGGGDAVQDGQVPGAQGASDDPVDLVSGQMFLPQQDLALPGVLPLLLERMHRSDYRRGRWFGQSWASTLDQRVEIDADGIHYAAPDGVVLHYQVPTQPGQQVLPSEGARWPLSWDRTGDTILIRQPESGRALHFPPGPTPEIARPLQAVADRNGNRITFVHDDEGVPTDVYHSGGYHVIVDSELTSAGTRISGLRLTDPAGGPATALVGFRYDPLGRLTDLLDSAGRPLIFEYDEEDRITGWIDRNAWRYGYEYDASGRVVRANGTGGYLAASFAYDLDARTTTVTDSLGHPTVHHWNERGQTVRVVDALDGERRTEQDRYNRLLSITDPLGRTTRSVRDEQGDPVRIERPDGTALQIIYNELRLPTTITGPDGAVWQHSYDERGNLLSTTGPDGATTTYEYDERGAMVAEIDALGQATRFEVNAAGLPVSITDALGSQTRLQRDAFGRTVAVTDPFGAVSSLGWTVEGRPAWRNLPDGARQEWTYDGEGNLVEYRDPVNGTASFEYGPFDKPVSRTDQSGAIYRFAYDTELRLVGVTNAAGLMWRYEYDAADNVVAETDFNGRTLRYRYDEARQLIERVNGAGQLVAYRRDPLGRVIEREVDGAVHRLAYSPQGDLMHAASPTSTLDYTRDAVGRVLAETVDGRTLINEYDAVGRRIRRTTPSGAVSQWTYGAAGLPATLATDAGALTFQHDAAGQEIVRYVGAGAAISQSFDAIGRLASQAVWAYDRSGAGQEPALLQQRTYTYRPDDYLVVLTDQLRGARRYELDPIGRVTSVQAATWSETYAYDALGNLAQATAPGDEECRGNLEHTGTLVRRAGRVSYEHDGQGRLVRTTRRTLSGQTKQWQYTWDADDRLTQVTTPDATWRYIYDPLGRRIAKQCLDTDGAVAEEITFAWDGSRLAEQSSTTAQGQVTALSWDWEPEGYRAMTQTHRSWAATAPQPQIDAAFYAIVADQSGMPTELVAPDGRIAWHTTTDIWGARIAAPDAEVDCPLRFAGQYHDAETGLHYNYLRYYDSATGAYASPDPLGLGPAPNPHAYVTNPLALIDPLGLAAYKVVHENDAGRFGDLDPGVPGDGLTPHHMPQAAAGFTSRDDGGAIVMTQADHALTRTYGARGRVTKAAEAGLPFRTVLARDIQDVRRIGQIQHGDPSYFNPGITKLLAYYRSIGML